MSEEMDMFNRILHCVYVYVEMLFLLVLTAD